MANAAAKQLKPIPTLKFERSWWNAGFESIAGVDEAGRGALAGPLVAAAVILPRNVAAVKKRLRGLDDSKMLTETAREHWFGALTDLGCAIGVGMVEAVELDELGLTAANRIAMERAVWNLPIDPDALLIDAFLLDFDLPQNGVIDGDALCLSISAASVIAKVTRDRIMVAAHGVDERYGFDRHKGYGVRAHLDALRLHGPCGLHRRSFAPVAECAR